MFSRSAKFLPLLLLFPAAVTAAPPNVLVILVDDLGYGDLSSYGAADLQTPVIDRLISQGQRWDSFYANCPVCSPTRASLMTGRYPDLVGVPGVIRTHAENSWGFLDPSAGTLPQILHNAGYATAIVGKWHLGLASPNTPNERGFDVFHGFLGDMMDDYYNHRRHGINYMRRDAAEIDPQGHATDLFSEWAIDYIEQHTGGGDPWFLYLAYNAPHTPIQPPDDWLEKVQAREPGIDDKRARLVALIEHLDFGIGRVLEALEASGEEENTLVIFTSDNGGQRNVGGRNGSLRSGKGDMYEGGIRVPFAARWPGIIAAGTRSEAVGLTMDIFATALDAAGVQPPHLIEGISLLPILRGKRKAIPERPLFWVRREGGPAYQGQEYYAVRRGKWKLLHNKPFSPLELYDLEADPGETTDLAADEPEVFGGLSRLMMRQIQRAGAVPWQRPNR